MATPEELRARARGNGVSALRAAASAEGIAPDIQATVDARDLAAQSSFSRGLQSSVYGMGAGREYSQALDAELEGDMQRSSVLRDRAQAQMQRAGELAPEINDYRDVHGVSDAARYASGLVGQGVGSMAPVLGAAAAARFLGPSALRGLTVPAAAYGTGYTLERDEAVGSQYQDPELAAMSAQARDAAATDKGLAAGAIEALVPTAAMTRRFGGSVVRNIAGQAVGEGVTEAAQQRVGQAAQESLRNDTSMLDEFGGPVSEEQRAELINAGFAGAAGGGVLSIPGAGLDALANAGRLATDTTRGLLDRDANAADPAGGPIDLSQLDDTPPLAPQTPLEARKAASTDPIELDRILAEEEQTLPQRAMEVAQNIVARAKDVPAELMEQANSYLAQPDAVDPQSLLERARGFDAGQATGAAARRGVDALEAALPKARELARKGLDAIDPGTKQSQERPDDTRLASALFDELLPQFKEQPGMRERTGAMLELMQSIDVQTPDRAHYQLLQEMAPALDMFADPKKVLPQTMREPFAAVTRARTEAQAADSWVSMGMVDEVRNSPARRERVGTLLDKAAVSGGKLSANERSLLNKAFGSRDAASEAVRNYVRQLPKLEGEGREKEVEAVGEDVAETHDLTETAVADAKVQYKFAGQGEQPYLRLRSEDGLRPDGKAGKITPAAKAVRQLREADPSRKARVVDMMQYAREQNVHPEVLAKRLRDGYAKRVAEGKNTPEEDVIFEGAETDEALLRAHQTVRTEQADNARDLMFNNDREMHAKARTLVGAGATKQERKANKKTYFTVERKTVNAAGRESVRPTTYSAESLWKYYGDRLQAEGKNTEGQTEAERAQNLFAQAIAEMAQDPSVESIDIPPGTVIDRKTGLKVPIDTAKIKARYPPNVRFERAEANYEADELAKSKLGEQDFERALRKRVSAEGRDPAATVDMLDALATADLGETKGAQRAYRRRRREIARTVLREFVDDTLPRPEREQLAGDQEGTAAEADKAFEAVRIQEQYVSELTALVGSAESMRGMLAGAVKELEARESAYDTAQGITPGYDPFTGEATLPSTKEAAYNASGVKARARKAQEDRRKAAERSENDRDEQMVAEFGTKNSFELITDNGSGESSASIEAINRARDEKAAGQTRLLLDRDGTVRPLLGVDAVDTFARPGQIIVQRNVGKDEWTVLSQGNDVSKDLAAGRINAARGKFAEALVDLEDDAPGTRHSKRRSKAEAKIPKADLQLIRKEMERIAGKGIKLAVSDKMAGAGSYTPGVRMIRLAVNAANPLGTAYHESLHDFFATLSETEGGRTLRAGLMKAAGLPHVRTQLNRLLAKYPEALKQIESDPEERAAYLFEFWALGRHHGKQIIQLGPETKNVLQKIADYIKSILGVVGEDERAEQVMNALYEGKFNDRSLVGQIAQDMGLETMSDKLRRISGPLADLSDKLLQGGTDRLRGFGHAALDELADMFHREPGREAGGLPFLQKRSQEAAKRLNQISALFEDTTAVDRSTALRNLQAMKTPKSPLEKKVARILGDMFDYMESSGVKKFDPKSKKWVALKKVQGNYFPRRWDSRAILRNEAKFRELLVKHGGMSPAQSLIVVKGITHGDGMPELADNEWHVGYTPAADAILDREFTFIDESNAAEFVEFQSSDLADVLTTYAFQAVHRAEFAKQFGNAGEKIQAALEAADTALDPKQQMEARTVVKGLVGTLGAQIDPRKKELFSAAITAENVVLLPLTIFSQVIDALGVGLRANDGREAWSAFKTGVGEIVRQVKRGEPGDDVALAQTLGLIDEQNMLEAMGQAHNGAFMSKFARDTNRRFFKWNGMEAWNRGMRVAAMVAGERFILRNAGENRYMRELGLDAKDIIEMPGGRLATTAEMIRAQRPSLTKAEAARRAEKVQEAVFKFVDGAVLRPNAAHRPVWGSDPHWMLVFHLKQFAFSFQKTILARVGNELDNNNMLPAGILAMYVPVILASDFLKYSITGQTIGDGSLSSILGHGIARSGILGVGSFGEDAFGDLARGQLPGTSFMGPTLEHAWLAGRYVVGDPMVDSSRLMDRSLPFARYF